MSIVAPFNDLIIYLTPFICKMECSNKSLRKLYNIYNNSFIKQNIPNGTF